MKNRSLLLHVGAGKTVGLYPLVAVLGLGAFGLTTSRAQTQVDASKAEPTYSVQRTYKAGDVDRYKLNIQTNVSNPQVVGANASIIVDMLMKETVQSITPEGTTTIIDEYEQANTDVNGQKADLTSKMPKVIQVRDKQGHTEVKTEGGDEKIAAQIIGMAQQMAQAQTLYLPSKPVKVGETWKVDASALTANAGATTLLTVKLESVDMLNGVKVLKLTAVSEITGGKVAQISHQDTKMHGETTTLIDAQTGKALKITSKTDGTTGGSKITVKMIMDCIESGDKKSTEKDSGAKKEK